MAQNMSISSPAVFAPGFCGCNFDERRETMERPNGRQLPCHWLLPQGVYPWRLCLRALRYARDGTYPVQPPPSQGEDGVWGIMMPCAESNRQGRLVSTKGPKVVTTVKLTQDIAKALDTTDVKETAPDQDTLVMFILGVEREAPFTRRPEV